MENQEFKAFVVEEKNGKFIGSVKTKRVKDLPPGDLLIKVHYSSLNYKDALSASGNKGITKSFPHTPGIDATGIIVESKSDLFKTDDKVIVTSYDLGMNTAGGFAEYIRVPSEWAVKLPESLSMKEAMIYGTAGLTAGISVLRLSELIKPGDGEIIISGATGGVGAISVSILSKLGYSVSAVTGKDSEHEFLAKLGAGKVIPRKDLEVIENKPMLKSIYAGAIDTVGGVILENMIKATKPMGVITCCGNVASPKLNLTIFPFILRGITLIGIDSQNYPMFYRDKVWKKLAHEWKPKNLQNTFAEITLDELPEKTDLMLKGQLKGRTILKITD